MTDLLDPLFEWQLAAFVAFIELVVLWGVWYGAYANPLHVRRREHKRNRGGRFS